MSRFVPHFESLKEMVYEYLQNQRAIARLKPGEKIRENEICVALKISRTPVREALIKLEAEGFLTILPRRGFIVKIITLKEIEDTYMTIGCLEGCAARLATPIMREGNFEMLIGMHKKMHGALLKGNFSDFTRYNLLRMRRSPQR
jgi:DNA-binding GntR family transcriptional regulator